MWLSSCWLPWPCQNVCYLEARLLWAWSSLIMAPKCCIENLVGSLSSQDRNLQDKSFGCDSDCVQILALQWASYLNFPGLVSSFPERTGWYCAYLSGLRWEPSEKVCGPSSQAPYLGELSHCQGCCSHWVPHLWLHLLLWLLLHWSLRFLTVLPYSNVPAAFKVPCHLVPVFKVPEVNRRLSAALLTPPLNCFLSSSFPPVFGMIN